MSDLEEVDVTKEINENDEEIQLSEPEDEYELEDGEIPEDSIKEATVFPSPGVDTYIPQQIYEEDEDDDEDELEEGEIPEPKKSSNKKAYESKQLEVLEPEEKSNVADSSDSSGFNQLFRTSVSSS